MISEQAIRNLRNIPSTTQNRLKITRLFYSLRVGIHFSQVGSLLAPTGNSSTNNVHLIG